MSKKELTEELSKSIESLVDELFAVDEDAVEEVVEKSLDIAGDSKTTADAAVKQAPKAQKDESRGAGRPKQISDVPQEDEDGKREGKYDDSITENEGKEDENGEAKKQIGSTEQMTKSVSDEEWAEFQEFKKSKEAMKKSEAPQEDLIKAQIEDAISGFRSENEELRKAVQEQSELLKSLAKTPQRPKSVTSIEALQKGFDEDTQVEEETFSKGEILDVAEDLYKSGKIKMDHVIEIEQTGTCSDAQVRSLIERNMK